MPDITDPYATKKVNEVIFPLCEDIRAIRARILAFESDWYAGLNVTIGTGSDIIQLNRESEGVNSPTQDQITNAVTGLLNAAAAINDQVNGAMCVRTFTAE